MSDYRKEKVLRIPVEKCGINNHMARALEGDHPDLFNMRADRYFQIAPTEGDFIDYVLKSETDDGCGEYGKVDQGGAGTVATEVAALNIDVVDCGVPILSMHSTGELASKGDIYMMYKADKAFYAS